MDYRKIIISLARRNETVRAFAYRMAKSDNIVSASVIQAWSPFSNDQKKPAAPTSEPAKFNPNQKNFFVFTFDKVNDTMKVTHNGREIVSFRGEEAWGKAIDFFKRKFIRKELDPTTTHFLYTGKKGLVDISEDFAMAGKR